MLNFIMIDRGINAEGNVKHAPGTLLSDIDLG